jgi:hypothetical protein
VKNHFEGLHIYETVILLKLALGILSMAVGLIWLRLRCGGRIFIYMVGQWTYWLQKRLGLALLSYTFFKKILLVDAVVLTQKEKSRNGTPDWT